MATGVQPLVHVAVMQDIRETRARFLHSAAATPASPGQATAVRGNVTIPAHLLADHLDASSIPQLVWRRHEPAGNGATPQVDSQAVPKQVARAAALQRMPIAF